MCSFYPWAQLDLGRAAGLNPLEDCRPETGSWWWSSRAGLVAASSSPPLPWHQSHHALHPSHLPSQLPNIPSHWSIRATTGTSNQRRGQLFYMPSTYFSNAPQKPTFTLGLALARSALPRGISQGIQGFVTHDPFPHLPSGCPNSNWNQISCFLRQDWRQGRRNSDRR